MRDKRVLDFVHNCLISIQIFGVMLGFHGIDALINLGIMPKVFLVVHDVNLLFFVLLYAFGRQVFSLIWCLEIYWGFSLTVLSVTESIVIGSTAAFIRFFVVERWKAGDTIGEIVVELLAIYIIVVGSISCIVYFLDISCSPTHAQINAAVIEFVDGLIKRLRS